MSNLCAVDEKPIPDTAVICHDCTTQIEDALRAVPELMDDLALAFTKQARVVQYSTSAPAAVDAGAPLYYNLAASDAKAALKGVLTSWARLVHEERTVLTIVGWTQWEEDTEPQPVRAALRTPLDCKDTATSISGWLLQYTGWLRRHTAAADFHAEVLHAYARARRVIDAVPPKRYVGRCGFVWQGNACTNELWAHERAAEVECRECGTVWNVEGRRAGALAAVENVVQSPELIARALSSHGVSITAERIYNWRKRGKLTPTEFDPKTRRARYRIGDVLTVWEATQASPQNTANRKKDL